MAQGRGAPPSLEQKSRFSVEQVFDEIHPEGDTE
jgi:hypothetical protein